jgi:hypothetical protein
MFYCSEKAGFEPILTHLHRKMRSVGLNFTMADRIIDEND